MSHDAPTGSIGFLQVADGHACGPMCLAASLPTPRGVTRSELAAAVCRPGAGLGAVGTAATVGPGAGDCVGRAGVQAQEREAGNVPNTFKEPGESEDEWLDRICGARKEAGKQVKRIYVAGPMTGIKDFNYPAFNAADEGLRGDGWHVENPASNPVPKCGTWAGYMRMAIAQLVTCDAIWLLDGWERSKGACIEVRIAKDLGLEFPQFNEPHPPWCSGGCCNPEEAQ